MQSETAVQQAATVAEAFSGKVTLLGMLQPGEQAEAQGFIDPVAWNAARTRKHAALTEVVARLEGQGVPVEMEMLDVSSAMQVLRHVDAGHFDLVVVSEQDAVLRAMLREMLTYSSTPICVARGPAGTRFRRIMVPLDGSQRAECMLPLATTLAQSLGATLLLTHIIKEPEMPQRMSHKAEDIQLVEQLLDRSQQESERYLNELVARLPVPAETYIAVHQSIATALQDVIRQQAIDLVAVCAHGYVGLPEQPLGGITNSLLEASPASVLIRQDLPSALPQAEFEANGRHPGGG
ncbi:MAG: universal stress protein [Chloroflexi bacterium]|nr:universal stress protein [Chloroflexota bacterium]